MSDPKRYTIGWISAILFESVAARVFLDEKHDGPISTPEGDQNSYTLGRIGRHNVVMASLPMGVHGVVSAATVARDMIRSFPNVRFCLMVGVGGGAPSQRNDIRLGDVVVSTPSFAKTNFGGVVQYDYGKSVERGRFQSTRYLNRPPEVLLTAVANLSAEHIINGNSIDKAIDQILRERPRLRQDYSRPDVMTDKLYSRDGKEVIERSPRTDGQDNPAIHYGLVASADTFMERADIRDMLAEELGVLCFEMEAAGLMNNFPCIVIRGICDYSDSNWSKAWRGYAAMTAAAYAKELIQLVSAGQVEAEKGIGQLVDEVSTLRQAVEEARADKKRTGLLTWLSNIDPSGMFNAARNKHNRGTNEWLVKENEAFRAWITSPASLLWLHGKVGSGKSILCSSVIQHLQDTHGSDPQIALAYFFFSFSDMGKQEVNAMLASLIKQLCVARPDTPYSVARLGEDKERGHRPGTDKLEEALIATACGFSHTFIVIDGLDECPQLEGKREKLLEVLNNIMDRAPRNLHVFCTSRTEPDIAGAMDDISRAPGQSFAEIDLTAKRRMLDGDIDLYVRSTLASKSYKSWPEDIKNEARDTLLEKADGMFQYVSHQLDVLKKLSNIPSVRRALGDLPNGLDETYERVLLNTEPSLRHQIKSMLQWLAFSRRLLTLDELAEIFILHPESDVVLDIKERLFEADDVLKYLASLVAVAEIKRDPAHPTGEVTSIRLVHFSIKEYLISSRIADGPVKQFSFSESNAHLHIAHSCIAYHLHRSSTKEPSTSYTLARYAADYWMFHLEMTPRQCWPEETRLGALRALGAGSQSLLNMFKRSPLRSRGGELCRPLCLTALWGRCRLSEMLLCADEYTTQEDLDCALVRAAMKGHLTVARLLLDRGADFNAAILGIYDLSPEERRIDAFEATIWSGNEELLTLLLDRGADINKQRGKGGTALQIALANRKPHLAKLLIKRGAGIDVSNEAGSALTLAVSLNDPTEMLEYLLDNDVDVNTWDVKYGTALQRAASSNKSVTVLRLLLDRGAEVNAPGGPDGSVLQAACCCCGLDEVKFLLGRGADVNSQSGFYGTPLQAACFNADGFEVAMHLLQNGAEVNVPGGRFGSALQAACVEERRGSGKAKVAMVRLLLSRGADVDAAGGYCGTALQIAAEGGDVELVNLLLDHGAQVNVEVEPFGSALQAACCGSSLKHKVTIVQLLLSRGADINAEGGRHGTALQVAASQGNADLINLLLSHGARVDVEGGRFGTAIQAACWSQNVEAVRLLLQHGANLHVQGGCYGSAWHAAVSPLSIDDDPKRRKRCRKIGMGSPALLCLLLDHDDKTDVNDARGLRHATALHATLAFEYPSGLQIKRLRFLLDRCADVNLAAGKYGFPLQAACAVEYWPEFVYQSPERAKNVEFLLENCPGIDVNARGGVFGSALEAAAYSGQRRSAELLLSKGADGNAVGGKYGNPLNAAVVRGNWDVVRVLLRHGATPDSHRLEGPDEEWLGRVGREDGRGAVERYRRFWEVQRGRCPRVLAGDDEG
ncbi:hypothetical protein L249_0689 [Ophiocordyceps polyrhachis-furcata BCC 54312]|uniref:Uncharacterized protein n=1 Tax=Ophiocordyceps polyrhachis-furcata BCC 54312 TaxID=1330021 RepID=A0A367LD31_9HYPO|nr:hypothetical protein L249_0689 [Ophiocordyceps polyrhachis-furcata BCC 54312]